MSLPKPKMTDKQIVTNTFRGHVTSTPHFRPESMEDMRTVRREKLAFDFANQFMGGKVDSKKEYIKNKQISRHTLDKGLKEAMMMKPTPTKRKKRQPSKSTPRGGHVEDNLSIKGGQHEDNMRTIINQSRITYDVKPGQA